MRGQSAVEYASILVLVLLAMIPIAFIGLQYIENANRISQAQAAVDAMVEAADITFSQGPGARTTVDVYFPPAINPDKTGASGKEIRMNVYLASGTEHDVFGLAKGNVTGTIPTTPGFHRLRFEMLGSGVVQITEPS